MADIVSGIKTAIDIGKSVVGDEKVQNFLCGSYADGSPRSLTDAINGEYLSPKQKDDAVKKTTSKKKKKKNKKFKL